MHPSQQPGERPSHTAGPAPTHGSRGDGAGAGDSAAAAGRAAAVPPAREAGRDAHSSTVGRLAATVARLRTEVRAAHAAADGRALIELAKGVLIERLTCGPAEAARQLAALADQADLSQLELAADIVNQASQDRLSQAAGEFLARTKKPAATPEGGAAPKDPGLSAAVRLRTAESGALAADDTQAVARSLLEHALAPLGATAVAIWAAGHDASLTLAGNAGFTAEEAGRWRYVPPGVATVARHALTDRQAVWFPTLSDDNAPSIGRRDTSGGRVAVPAGTGGRILGVLEICWPHPVAPQPPRIRRQIEALAELCAHTLEARPVTGAAPPAGVLRRDLDELTDLADGLHDPALVLLPHLDPDGHLTDFRIRHTNRRFADPAGRPRSAVSGALLLEAYPMAAGDSGLFEAVERVHATGEPFRAERMTLTALVDQVPLAAVADISISRHGGSVLLLWRIEDEAARLASLLQHAQRLGRIGGFEENALTGEVIWNRQLFALHGLPPAATPVRLEDLPAHAHPDDAVALGRFLRTLLHHRRPASTAFRLQRPDGVTRHVRLVAEPVLEADGRLLALRGAYQDISAQHWTEVALAATRDQLAHTEQEAAERDRLTLQLQHAIMPPARAPLDAPGLNVAVRYRPAETEHLVGGDWYDAVVLPSRRILLCVGDVAGHGIGAATSMIVLRNALRGLAVTGAGPAQLMTWLNIVAHHLTERITATAVCGLYDPADRTLRWARAGHLPPVLVSADRTATLPLLKGVLLGAMADALYEEGEIRLARGDTLLMFTDGLVERKGSLLQDSLDHLIAAAKVPTATLEQRLDRLLTHSRADTDDDTCLVGVQAV
ncbi:antitermination regulator [Streptomyces albireticuli]|uniref:Antitermination regulator n=1 Tax=Streptomyces albireticuli TaxID=1940 RepID=A0A1Z2LCV7_9ACTN|nr:antitermination regulator [Streptomyces albireticuli]